MFAIDMRACQTQANLLIGIGKGNYFLWYDMIRSPKRYNRELLSDVNVYN